MASSEYADRQTFQSKDGTPLTKIQSHPCTSNMKKRYVLWSDIQRAFQGIDHLETYREKTVLFMVDADGELSQPLRIQHERYTTYIVIYHNNQIQKTDEWLNIPQESVGHGQGHSQNLVHDETQPSLKDLFETCKYLYQYSKTVSNSWRVRFHQAAANTRYYHSMFIERVEKLKKSGANTLVDGKSLEKLLEELHDLEQHMPEWEYQSTCRTMLCERNGSWYSTTSSLFLALPLNLDSWDASNMSTHQFRLYFLCDNWKQHGALENMPQHVHLSNHPGYLLQRQQEFFRTYGDYVLRMLLMIKSGHSNKSYEIPPLDTPNKILWGCDPDTIGSHINMDTIGILVDKAIDYLQEISPPKWTTQLALNHDQSAAIRTFLDVQDDQNSEGNLYRYIDTFQCAYWICQAHMCQYFDKESLEELGKFAESHRGRVEMQQARLEIELGSPSEAEQFRTLLKACRQTFDISIRLTWNATPSCVKELCSDIAKTRAEVLEIDGITSDENLQIQERSHRNLFSDVIVDGGHLQKVTLLNYPRPQEQCIHFQQCSVQSPHLSARFHFNWKDLRSDLKKFAISVSGSQVAGDYNAAMAELHSVLEKHGLSDATIVTVHGKFWDGVFDLEKNAFVELLSNDLMCPKGVLCSGSLRTLGVHLDNAVFDQEFFDMVKTNMDLQKINVSYFGNDILSYTVDIIQMWHEFSSPFRLTLIDRLEDTQGRIIAELAIGDDSGGSKISRLPGDNTFDFRGGDNSPTLRRQNNTDVSRNVTFKQWDCDHIFSQLSDYSAVLMSMAVQQQYPSALTLLSLDVSRLSTFGLISIQEILHRSNLENLNIKCTLIQPNHANTVAQILGSVQWNTLKSLALLGSYINEWIELWPTPCECRLLCFHIQGATPMQTLSHSSTLFLQKLIFSSPLMELRFRNVQLQDKRDWALFIDSVDLSLLQTLDLSEHGAIQFFSMPDAVGLFVSGLEATHSEGEGPKLILPSFTLDITALSQPGLVNLQKIFRYCILKELIIENDLIDHIISRLVAKALNSLHRPLLEYLWVSGDDTIQWIQLLAKDEMSRLKILQILREKLAQKEISHANSLSIERLVGTSSPKELNFKDVLLQEQLEWGAPYQEDGSLHGELLSERQQLGAGHVDPRRRYGVIEE